VSGERDRLPTRPKNSSVQVSDDTLRKLVDNETRKLSIREQELTLEAGRQNNDCEIAKTSIAAQERDRKDDRENRRQRSRDRYRLALALTIVFALLAAILTDKDQLAMELVKYLVLVIASAAGGYFTGRQQAAAQRDAQGGDED
jgi:cation transport ATPase